jgi:hypothetical protein
MKSDVQTSELYGFSLNPNDVITKSLFLPNPQKFHLTHCQPDTPMPSPPSFKKQMAVLEKRFSLIFFSQIFKIIFQESLWPVCNSLRVPRCYEDCATYEGSSEGLRRHVIFATSLTNFFMTKDIQIVELFLVASHTR